MLKVIIAGGRDFTNYTAARKTITLILKREGVKNCEIVSGGARGADRLGEEYASIRGLELKVFPADWNRYGNYAGPRRNKQMAEYADIAICFWDYESRGTKHMIDTMAKMNKPRYVILYDEEQNIYYPPEFICKKKGTI